MGVVTGYLQQRRWGRGANVYGSQIRGGTSVRRTKKAGFLKPQERSVSRKRERSIIFNDVNISSKLITENH